MSRRKNCERNQVGQQPPERFTEAARVESLEISGTATKHPRRHFNKLRWNSFFAGCSV